MGVKESTAGQAEKRDKSITNAVKRSSRITAKAEDVRRRQWQHQEVPRGQKNDAQLVYCSEGVAVQVQSPQATKQEAQTLNLHGTELLAQRRPDAEGRDYNRGDGLHEAEDAAFWPVYREYDLEMAKLGDERVSLIEEYANAFDKMNDAIADKLATRALDLEARRQAVKAKCYERVKKVLSPQTALRFLQVEHQLQLVIDLQISASLPIAAK